MGDQLKLINIEKNLWLSIVKCQHAEKLGALPTTTNTELPECICALTDADFHEGNIENVTKLVGDAFPDKRIKEVGGLASELESLLAAFDTDVKILEMEPGQVCPEYATYKELQQSCLTWLSYAQIRLPKKDHVSYFNLS